MVTIRECAQKCFDLFEQWSIVASSGEDPSDSNQTLRFGETDIVEGKLHQTERTGSTAAGPHATTDRKFLFDLVKLENCMFRFNLWADYYSVTSSGHDSLDWRLRESSTTYSVVLDLIEDLSRVISGE
jgi:hypothetical protein